MGERLPYVSIAKLRRDALSELLNGKENTASGTYRSALISPHTVDSLATSPISIKYLHSWICTAAARYQQI